MKKFVENYLDKSKKLKILDIGSFDLNGSYKELFDSINWKYYGADIEEGPNVDIILKGEYDLGIDEESFDVVVSGQCLEHVKDVKLWIEQIKKVVKPGGIVCIIAPWKWPEHKHPVDCWRILPDGMTFLLKEVCKFKILEVFLRKNDCVGIAKRVSKTNSG